MANIGIFGGTFDPVHLGHRQIALRALQSCGLQQIWFLPSAHPPHKQGHVYANNAHRVAMLRCAVQQAAQFSLCTVELDTPNLRYSIDTMRILRRQYPMHRLTFLVGGDSLLNIERWHEAPTFLRETPLIAVSRPGGDVAALLAQQVHLRQCYGARVRLLLWEGLDISSTAVRAAAAQGQDVTPFCGQAVADYIRQQHLYPNTEAPT